MNIWLFLISCVLTNNFIFSKFLGCCPFLGVSKQGGNGRWAWASPSRSSWPWPRCYAAGWFTPGSWCR